MTERNLLNQCSYDGIPVCRTPIFLGAYNEFPQWSGIKGDADQAERAYLDLGLTWQIKPSSQA